MHEYTLRFERADKGDEVGDVAAFGGADAHKGGLGNGGARAAAGEKFADQVAVGKAGEDLAALHAFVHGVEGGAQQAALLRQDAAVFQTAFGFFG